MILARGGGDAADLLPWSEEGLCRAIAAAAVPVISAIGHEADRPLCDEVADLRCGTPSLAATAVIPDRELLWAELDEWVGRAAVLCETKLDGARRRVAAAAPARALDERAASARHRLARAGDSLAHHHPRASLTRAKVALASLEREREALSPVRVLERGYAVVRRSNGGPAVRSAGEVAPGERVKVTLASGTLVAAVEETSG